jgi:hypothetical protein
MKFSDFEKTIDKLDIENMRIGVLIKGVWYDRESNKLSELKKDYEELVKAIYVVDARGI